MDIKTVMEIEGGPDPLWYYAKGHVDKGEFIAEMFEKVKADYFGGSVYIECLPTKEWAENLRLNDIHHQWWHFFPTGRKDPKGCWAQMKEPGRGTMPVTVID
ncbi:MAG TPA: hypothetical protein ENI27_10795, partial [bacterium]|nr:hypothetical protein [bacterium]